MTTLLILAGAGIGALLATLLVFYFVNMGLSRRSDVTDIAKKQHAALIALLAERAAATERLAQAAESIAANINKSFAEEAE